MLQTVEALIDDLGHVKWLEAVHFTGTHRALITILDKSIGDEKIAVATQNDFDIPSMSVGAWPQDFSLSRQNLYNDDGR